METYQIFSLGAIGALAPEIARLYSIKHRPEEFNWSSFYIVISLLFAALGGVVALVLPATTYWGALYAGVSTPTLLNVAAKRVSAPQKQKKKALPPLVVRKSYVRSFLEGL